MFRGVLGVVGIGKTLLAARGGRPKKPQWSSNLVQTPDDGPPKTSNLCESSCEVVVVTFPTPHPSQTALQTRDLRDRLAG
jgi:hypothetical protein